MKLRGFAVIGPRTKNVIVFPTYFDANFYLRTKYPITKWLQAERHIRQVIVLDVEEGEKRESPFEEGK